MSNTYTQVGSKRSVRVECALDQALWTPNYGMNRVVIEAFEADVFVEVDEQPSAEAPTMTKPKDLETARRELAQAIDKAKTIFERDTGTILTDLTVDFMEHHQGGHIDKSIIKGVGLNATYPSDVAYGRQVTWSAT